MNAADHSRLDTHFSAGGPPVGLEQMLEARELRAARQAAALTRFQRPIVSVTVVTPGPVKDGPLPRRVLAQALAEIDAVCGALYWPILLRTVIEQATGPEALFVVGADARLLKARTVELEEKHPLGRLWDLDVIVPGPRTLSRKEFGFGARRCLACDQPAFECGRSRRHPLQELSARIETIVREHDRSLAFAAVEAGGTRTEFA